MRSKLFVPGSRPELFGKALAGDADAISFDVEDSVPEDSKASARERIVEFLRSAAARDSGKLIIVRINGFDSGHWEQDLTAFARAPVALLNVPKAQCAEDVRRVAAALEEAERRNGVERPIGLLVNIETARGLRLAAEIANAHSRVAGLQLGLADLFESLNMERDPANVHAVMFAMRMACGESGRFAYDSAYPDVSDAEGFRREAAQARKLGYVGKSCVHPKQVALANEIFGAGTLDLTTARRIVAAAQEAAKHGRGAFLLDGRMIDLPFVKRAQAVLAEASDSSDRS
jgi:citrate lyase subunit beta / citryl-CoA lyase